MKSVVAQVQLNAFSFPAVAQLLQCSHVLLLNTACVESLSHHEDPKVALWHL